MGIFGWGRKAKAVERSGAGPAAARATPIRVISKNSIFEQHLDRNAANYVPMSPIGWLKRAADIYPDYPAIIHGERRFSYQEFHARCCRLGSALEKLGIGPGDTVAIMSPNTPAMLEAHYGVPATGAVLNPLNVRLDADTIAFILRHGEAKALLTDTEFAPVIKQALAKLGRKLTIIDIDDIGSGERLGDMGYEALLANGDPEAPLGLPADEWQPLLLSYTSGTTGDPKGVVYHHRGAYINSMANVPGWAMPKHPVFLWTLPIFHSLGWCFPWTISIMAGIHVCLRRVEAGPIFRLIAQHGVTHMCGAPIVLNTLINARPEDIVEFPQRVKVQTAASPPPAAVIRAIEERGFDVQHVYGLTEVYGPSTICEWQRSWDGLTSEQKAQKKARQGVAFPSVQELRVMSPATMTDVPRDGQTMGEVMKRSNTIMRGYLKNAKATTTAFAGGYFHTGDLAVWHPDGYIELKDRSKDIIISGGENISTIEVEGILYQHPAVLEAAVVARPDDRWGETPCAFVELKSGASASAEEIVAHCRERLAHFKAPKAVVFGPLPKTSTGKVQKFILRERAKDLQGMPAETAG